MSPLVPNVYSYSLGVGALNGFVVAVLLARTRGQQPANRLLAALVAVVALRLVPYILGYAGFYDAYPWLSFAPFDLPLAVGPLLWLYVVTLTGGAPPRSWRWHLLPAAVHFAIWSLVFVGASVTQKDLISTHVLPWVVPPIALGGSAGFAWYTLLTYRRYTAYQRFLDDTLSSREEYRLGWLRTLIILLGITAVVMTGFVLTEWFITPLDYFDEYPLYLWLAILCYTIGLLAWRGSATIYPELSRAADPRHDRAGAVDAGTGTGAESIESPRETGVETRLDTGVDGRPLGLEVEAMGTNDEAAEPARAGVDWQALGERYAAHVRDAGWWRDPQLTLPVLARRLGSNTTYLSRALNTGLHTTFNQFVNRLRAEEVADRLRNGDERELLDIAHDAGFSSKASFQRAFREHVGGTPGEFRRRVRAEGGPPST